MLVDNYLTCRRQAAAPMANLTLDTYFNPLVDIFREGKEGSSKTTNLQVNNLVQSRYSNLLVTKSILRSILGFLRGKKK